MPFFWQRPRPMHLGRFPMEKIKRVSETTTKITDNVPRMPKRAHFFQRARFGDLGPKPQQEVRRFATKYPLSMSMGKVTQTQATAHDGDVAPEKAPLPEDLHEIAEHIKATCYFLDADLVGICEMPDYAWYSHDIDGNPITAKHKYAIVLVIDQGFETMEASSGDDWISGSQSFRAYLKGSTIMCTVASFIRELGYEARAHTNADSEVLHNPLTMLAGLGELSRIGEVVLNPFLGPRFKTAVITTNLPMAVDQPIDFGLQDICGKCRKCARECPAGALSFGDKVMFNGYEMWKPDVEACTRYRVTNPNGSACGRCMKMCPFNKQGLTQHRLWLWTAIRVAPPRKFLIWLVDALGYGKRKPVWKWWLDLEIRDGKVSKPANTNQRDLRLGRPVPKERIIPIYQIESIPPPGSHEPHPLDRQAAQARSAKN